MLPFYLTMIDNEKDKLLLEEFYKLYRQDMFKIAKKILKNETDAEEAVSEAFLRIANNFSKIKDVNINQSRAFAAVTVENIAKNIFVYRRNRPADNIEDFEDICDDENLEDDYERKASVDAIKVALRLLPDKYYSVLYITLVCGFSIPEASDLLGLSRENTKKILTRAKRKIKEITKLEVSI
jgi:RNA polymerase sigma-70 factor (ECF subfamily)